MLDNARRWAPPRTLGVLCVCILFGMLVAGLWPFHQPHNEVTWVTNAVGLRFRRHGTILSSSMIDLYDSDAQAPCSLEIWLQPDNIDETGTLLAFYSSDNLQMFSLRQEGSDLGLEVERRDAYHRITTSRIYVDNVFRQGTPALVTISSGAPGTVIYLDGAAIKAARSFRVFNADLTGRLVVGTSPTRSDNWSGQLRGLAIYRQGLTAVELFQHYRAWQAKSRPYAAGNERGVALYLFDEHSGNVVHDRGSTGVDLYIPERYTILHEKFLEPAWKEFNVRWGYWKSALINIGGFVPFGFFFCAYLSLTKPINRAAVATIVLGTTVSLTIEVLQAYLPTRDSGTTDLITNTLGTGLGVMLYRWRPALFTEALNRIPSIARITACLY